jgi:RNA polymerase sigma-70 factor (ECF subfamily)
MVHTWCQRWGLRDDEADDVSQEVLAILWRKLSTYDSSKRFRPWLKTVARRAVVAYLNKKQRAGGVSASSGALERLATCEAQDDLAARVDTEYERELLEKAMRHVAERAPQSWKAFDLLAIRQLSGEEVSRALGISVAAAYVARSRIQKMLREEIERLQNSPLAKDASP